MKSKSRAAWRFWATGLVFFPAATAWAGPQTATVTQVDGNVQVYSHPSASGVEGPPPHAKFEGLYYSVADAHAGDVMEKSNILRTQPGARAQLIFENGDQIYVAPASSFRVSWSRDTADAAKAKPALDLDYGKSRFVIEKGGPRSRFKIRTRTAVMGVRGTDFFVAVNNASGATEVATLRGAVAVQSKAPASASGATPRIEPTLVHPGETASVTAASASPKPDETLVTVHKTTQSELRAVERTSAAPAHIQSTTPEITARVEKLEDAAATITLKDISAATPEVAQKAKENGATERNPAVLNAAVVQSLAAAAPQESGPVGPIADESIEKSNSTPMVSSTLTSEPTDTTELTTPKLSVTGSLALTLPSLNGSDGGVSGSMRAGGGGALWIDYRIASLPRLGFELGVFYVERNTSGASTPAFELPLLARWWFSRFVSAGLGGFVVSQPSAPNNLQNFDFGLVASLAGEYRLSRRWSGVLDARYMYGLYNVAVTGNAQSSDFQILAGARFDLF